MLIKHQKSKICRGIYLERLCASFTHSTRETYEDYKQRISINITKLTKIVKWYRNILFKRIINARASRRFNHISVAANLIWKWYNDRKAINKAKRELNILKTIADGYRQLAQLRN